MTEADVRRIALSLPGVVERASYGTPGWRVSDRLFARLHEEDGVLVARCASEEEKRALVAASPDRFFTTAHYDGHPHVLVRLGAVDEAELREVLTDAWRTRAPKRLVAELDG
ncbi:MULTISPECIES: MmcQ/YjbR family DNA-binding protein [Actinosynnema]|uniref:MmcQ/YjbR family DNA-binding protein n=1 Tax=Actinosynnema TaxID=40566 RepID=UPI0020A5EAE7|nr:MmcQ/YjbR family DNA-binding protein [Actinosynnema pretiosum]MCP2094372.1 hypothetical protein [Actinosynnema pretiosum]